LEGFAISMDFGLLHGLATSSSELLIVRMDVLGLFLAACGTKWTEAVHVEKKAGEPWPWRTRDIERA